MRYGTNGMAQRQRRDWRDTFLIMHHFWQIAPAWSGRAAVRLEPVLGRFLFYSVDGHRNMSTASRIAMLIMMPTTP